MATYINKNAYIWVEFILGLVINLAVLFALLYLYTPNVKKFIHPIYISLFMTITTYKRGIGSDSFFYLFLFTLIFSLIPESTASNEGRELSEQENDTIENNEDNQAENNEDNQVENHEDNQTENNQTETVETNQNVQTEQTEKQDESFFEKLSSFNLITTFFVLFAWFETIYRGINEDVKYTYRFYKYSYGNIIRDGKILINLMFYHLFNNATYQFFYGIMVLNDNSPRWLYFFYMIPMAVFSPLSTILSYYVAQAYSWTFFGYVPYGSMLSALYLYFSFKNLHEFIQSCKEEGELKNKIINIALYAVGFLWPVFVYGIRSMNVDSSYY